MKPLSRRLAFTLLLGSLGLIGWSGAPAFPSSVISPQMQGSPAQTRVALISYVPNDPPATTHAISQIVVSNATPGQNGTATYTFTVSPAETLTAGQSVKITGLTGNLNILNNVAPVLATNLTSTTFSISTTDVYASTYQFPRGAVYATVADGTYATTGTDNFGTYGAVTVSATAPITSPII